jgi:hypothetical protein
LANFHWNAVKGLMDSAKQVGRRRPACRPQTGWRRCKLFLQVGQYLLDHHRVLNAGEGLPREHSEWFGHDPHRPAAFPAGLDIDIA